MNTPQKNPVEILEEQAILLERVYHEQQSMVKILSSTQKRKFSISSHAGSGAVISALIASMWVLHYLFTTVFGFLYHSMWEYVTGQAFNLETAGAEALFVVVTRFLLAFGISWAPVTFLVALIRKFV